MWPFRICLHRVKRPAGSAVAGPGSQGSGCGAKKLSVDIGARSQVLGPSTFHRDFSAPEPEPRKPESADPDQLCVFYPCVDIDFYTAAASLHATIQNKPAKAYAHA